MGFDTSSLKPCPLCNCNKINVFITEHIVNPEVFLYVVAQCTKCYTNVQVNCNAITQVGNRNSKTGLYYIDQKHVDLIAKKWNNRKIVKEWFAEEE